MHISPLQIPEVLEQVFLHLLYQTLWDSHEQKSLLSNSPRGTCLAILRVSKLWYNVGEPLLWRRIKWTEFQDPSIHQRFWSHWDRVHSFHFEFGNKGETAIGSESMGRSDPQDGASRIGPSGRLFNAATATGPNGALPGYVGSLVPVPVEGPSTISRIARNTIAAEEDAAVGTRLIEPRIQIYTALDDLARALSTPPSNPRSCRPRPLVLQEHPMDQSPCPLTPYLDHPKLSPLTTWNLYRSRLTHLTLTGLFRLESFFVAILPLVPELMFLDISLRCFEWRDELHLDKLLLTCPKLEYLSVDRNMIGSFNIHDEDEDEGMTANSISTGSNSEHDDDDYSGYTPGQVYSGTPWHMRFALPGLDGNKMSKKKEQNIVDYIMEAHQAKQNEGNDTAMLLVPTATMSPLFCASEAPRRHKTPRTMRLRTLKLKRVRMQEQPFLELLKHCSLLEEIDVYSTMYWSWSSGFLNAFKQYCPSLRHLHLTTNYVIPTNNPQPNALGLLIIHETQSQDGGVTSLHEPVVRASSDSCDAGEWDPVGELIQKFPDLLSYNARYVRFQNRNLLTLQQHCQRLETLDLTNCREVSSKSLIHFLRSTLTLRHLFADRVVLRIEDMISSSFQTKWWACANLETLIIGIKNPECPSTAHSTMSNDLQVERTADFQFYYWQHQESSSSRNGVGSSSSAVRHADGYGQPYNHIRLCTLILFQQIGRLRKLRRLELCGGRLDLGIKPNPVVDDISLPSSDQGPLGSNEKKGSSRGFALLSKIRSSLSKDSEKTKQARLQPALTQVLGKGKIVDRGDEVDDGGCEGDSNVDNDSEKLVPDDMVGLSPLAGLDKLKSFGLIWSNFPKLVERDVAWMCEHWRSLEWISLGMVPQTEWCIIRSWIQSRRPEITVIFEQH